MKISANAGALANALALAAACSDDRHAKKFPALEAVHIKTADGTVNVTSNTLDHALTLNAPATIETPGEIAVSGSHLAALAAAFPHAAMIEIVHDGNVARITCGRSRFKLPTVPLEDLPAMLKLAEETGRVDLAREEMSALLRPRFAMSTEKKTRFYMCGLLLCDALDGLVAVATDGYRLARVVIPGAAGLSQDHRLVVPAPAVEIIRKLLADKSIERVTLRRSRALAEVETKKAAFVSKLIDGTFPDYPRLLPKPSGNAVTVDCAEFAQALERVAAVADERQRRAVAGLLWTADEPALHLCLTDADTADDVISAEVTGSGRVAVQIKFLAELLDVLEGKRVRFDARSGADAVLVGDPGDEDFTAVQMPCRWAQVQAA